MRQLECVDESGCISVGQDEIRNHAIARVCLCATSWAVHGVIFELYGKRRTGCLLSVDDETPCALSDDNIIEATGNWIQVRQPYGFLTKVSGYNHSQLSFLCESIKLEFASGQVMECSAQRSGLKGERFSSPWLAENFLLNELVLEYGTCLGYQGVLMENSTTSTTTRNDTEETDKDNQQQKKKKNFLKLKRQHPPKRRHHHHHHHHVHHPPNITPLSHVLGWVPEEAIDGAEWCQEPLRVRVIPKEPKNIRKMMMAWICLADSSCHLLDGPMVRFWNGHMQGPLVVHYWRRSKDSQQPQQEEPNVQKQEQEHSQPEHPHPKHERPTRTQKRQHCRRRHQHYHAIRQPGGYIVKITGYQLSQPQQSSTQQPQQSPAQREEDTQESQKHQQESLEPQEESPQPQEEPPQEESQPLLQEPQQQSPVEEEEPQQQPPKPPPTQQQSPKPFQRAFHSLRLEFASGQIIQYQPDTVERQEENGLPLLGKYFSYDIPHPETLYVNQLVFWNGSLQAIGGVQTTRHVNLQPQDLYKKNKKKKKKDEEEETKEEEEKTSEKEDETSQQ